MSVLLLLSLSALADDRLYDEESPTRDDQRLFDEDGHDRLLGWSRDLDGRPKPIINGDAGEIDDFPSAGGIVAEGSLGALSAKLFMCSSTLIAPDVVLTAAHCVDFEDLIQQQYGVTLDTLTFHWSRETDLSAYQLGAGQPALPDDAVEGSAFVFHDDWVGADRLVIGLAENNDLGLIFLDEPITDVPLAILPTAEEAELIEEDDTVWAVGWGQTGPQQGAAAGVKEFGESHIAELGETEFKVGDIVSDVRKCHGDSGGPSYWELEVTETLDPLRQIGITSHAYDFTDCNETGGVDTRIDFYLEWIDETMREACEDGTRSWCPTDDRGDDLVEDWGVLAPPVPEAERGLACGCQTPGLPLGGWVWAVPGLLLLRRRSQA